MAEINEYTAITDSRIYGELADVIRDKTGINVTISPEEMPDLVRSLNCVKKWDITITEDKTTDFFLFQDNWLAEHHNADNLVLIFLPISPLDTSKTYGVIFSLHKVNGLGVNANYSPKLTKNVRLSTNVDGFIAGGGGSFSNNTDTLYGTTNPVAGYFALMEDGSLYMGASTYYTIKPGNYYIMAWLE